MQSNEDVQPALPKGSLILVTGATGFIGANVVTEALLAGYHVRGTSRTQQRADETVALFNNPNYSAAVVPDMSAPGAWDAAMRDVHAVIHLAADVSLSPDPNQVITPTEEGARSILRSAQQAGTVRRFVLTSSSMAVYLPQPDKEMDITIDDWAEDAVEMAWAPPPYEPERALVTYAASKVAAEKALWKFVEEETPGFVVNAVLPNLNLGRILTAGGPTGGSVEALLKGTVPPFGPQHHIDVIDDARIHLIAAIDPSVKNERIFAFARPYTFTEMIELLKELRPDVKTLAAPPENEGQDLSKVPNELGRQLLRKWYGQEDYKTLRQSVEECLASLQM